MYTMFSNSNAPKCEKYFTPNWGIACVQTNTLLKWGNFYPIYELPTRGNFYPFKIFPQKTGHSVDI
jgi:hypothetical protein